MIKYAGLLFTLLFSLTSYTENGSVGSYLRLTPTTPLTKCAQGEIRFSSVTGRTMVCDATDTWHYMGGTSAIATADANKVMAGPASGDPALPSFRSLVSADIPNNAADTSGNAATATAATTATKWATARSLAGNSVDGSAAVPFANKFIVQGTTDAGLSGAQFGRSRYWNS
jgi:hypothetical protein